MLFRSEGVRALEHGDFYHHLDAPVKRIAATDTFVAYQPILENAILPQASDLFRAMKELAEF